MPVNNWAPRTETMLRDLERRVKKLETQPALNASGVAGNLTVVSPGVIAMKSGSFDTYYVGQRNLSDGSGRTEMAFLLYRDDGSIALALADFGTTPGHPHRQALQWYDRSGHTVFSDDTDSGVGVARPHLAAYALQNTNISTWPATNATSMTEIAAGYIEYQQPKLSWQIEVYAPASVTGAFELQVNGNTVGTTTVVGGASGMFAIWGDTQPMPAGLTWGSVYPMSLSGQVTAGTGTINAQCYFLQGQGT